MTHIPPHTWQKSTFSPDGSDCVYVATAPDGTIRLRESDEPGIILRTARTQLGTLISTLKHEAVASGSRRLTSPAGCSPLAVPTQR
ncbi:DUF397 domain-containing protein [Streptomyces venezuelae]|uniref:DUF397 domain-containing protein n=1 Tax=Streptomyces venezuelae TaxID=54571 RepID=UPI00365CCC4A